MNKLTIVAHMSKRKRGNTKTPNREERNEQACNYPVQRGGLRIR